MRSSLPLLLVSMTIFSLTMNDSGSSHALSSWSTNATESVVDYTKNDLLLGSPDPLFWFLIPISGLLGVGACTLVNYAALSLVHILHFITYIGSSLSCRVQRNHHRYVQTATEAGENELIKNVDNWREMYSHLHHHEDDSWSQYSYSFSYRQSFHINSHT